MSKTIRKPGQASHSPKQIQDNAMALLKTACEQMVGPGHFEKFSKICQLRMVSNRVPTLKLKAQKDSGISGSDLKMYNEIFAGQLKNIFIETLTGSKMPLNSYLREGILLINYVEVMEDERLTHYHTLKELFAPYERSTQRFIDYLEGLVQLLYRMSMLCCNFKRALMTYKIDEVAAFSGDGTTNEIIIGSVSLERSKIKIKDFSREVFQLGWPDYNGNVKEIKLRPSKIGLKLRGDKAVNVYLQKHAIQRLEQRLGIVPGISHYHLYTALKSNNSVAHAQGSTTLVEYSVYDKKLGYLVCGIYEEQIVVRTFLFLTNDGTPEGNRLSELTRLELLDKQYLGIDTLEGFLRFGIAEDPALKDLFTQAGCESLLELNDVKPFVVSKVAPKDSALLLQYLMGLGQQRINHNLTI